MNILSPNCKENIQSSHNSTVQEYSGNRSYPSAKKVDSLEQFSDFTKRKILFHNLKMYLSAKAHCILYLREYHL
ncbi:hypothetical protein WA026_005066 [Henosepilachna vigintioctopunctata]|uniref:Uncharacterized protein n=1 Tax=Henosepilachna vigintioctopunctata TaxID=420089 RepID=A0AAW1UKS1_9CUCU